MQKLTKVSDSNLSDNLESLQKHLDELLSRGATSDEIHAVESRIKELKEKQGMYRTKHNDNQRTITVKSTIEVTKSSEDGTFTALVSTSSLDKDNDRILDGAWNESLKVKNTFPLLLQHSSTTPIGSLKARTNSSGLIIDGQLDLENQTAKTTYKLMKTGAYNEFSVGFLIENYVMNEFGGFDISKAKLTEVSIVSAGANPDTRIIDVKEDEELIEKKRKEILANLGIESETNKEQGEKSMNKTSYLDTKQAYEDFKEVLSKNGNFRTNWENHLKEKSITGYVLPSVLSTSIRTAFESSDTIFNTFEQVPSVYDLYVGHLVPTVGDFDLSQAFAEGLVKTDTVLETDKKNITAEVICSCIEIPYSMHRMNPQMIDTFLLDVLPRAVVSRAEMYAVIGHDSDETGFEAMTAATSTFTTSITPTTSIFEDIMTGISKLKGEAINLVISRAKLVELRKENPTIENLTLWLGVSKIFTPDWMADDEIVLYVSNAYTVIGDISVEQQNSYNMKQNKFGQEFSAVLGGALTQPNSCAVIK